MGLKFGIEAIASISKMRACGTHDITLDIWFSAAVEAPVVYALLQEKQGELQIQVDADKPKGQSQ